MFQELYFILTFFELGFSCKVLLKRMGIYIMLYNKIDIQKNDMIKLKLYYSNLDGKKKR